MKNKKWLVGLLSVACLMASAFAFASCGGLGGLGGGNNDVQEVDGLQVQKIQGEKGYAIVGIEDKEMTEVEIPSEYDGVAITSIGYRAFYDCDNLTKVVIPDSVTTIGEEAFKNCGGLLSVEMGKNVAAIEHAAFFECYYLSEITLPDSVTSIADSAFWGCLGLTELVIPDSVTSMGDGVFKACDALTVYCEAKSKPSGWSEYWATNSNVEIRPIVWDCKNNDVADDGCIYTVIEGVRYAIKDNAANVVIQSHALKTANIQSSITYKNANYSVASINEDAFSGCRYLTSAVIGNGIASIGEDAFHTCDSLTEIVVPESVTTIGKWAFSSCNCLTIYCEVASRPSGWYYEWETWNDLVPVVWDCKNNDVATDGYIHTVMDGVRYAIKDGVALVARQAITIQKANIASSITYKGTSYSVTEIYGRAFENCTQLTETVIPASVTHIGGYAFYNCDSLTEVKVPDGVTVIGVNAFANCDNLKSFVVSDSVTVIGNNAFELCKSLTGVVIGKNVTSIGKQASAGCEGLTEVVIPESVTSIEKHAFQNCKALKIYCQAASQPSGWEENWNSYNCPVEWGYKAN